MTVTDAAAAAGARPAGTAGGPRRHEHWINGRSHAPGAGSYFATRNPATREAGDEIAAGTAADVELAVAAAEAAWPSWAARPARERSDALHAVADAMAAATDELAALEWASTGKTAGQLDVEIRLSIDYFRFYAGVVRAHGGRTIDLGAGAHTYTRLEPYGVIGAITPWNLPLNQASRALAPALAVGNAIVAKPSEFTSPSTVLLARLATQAGLPDGLLNVVTGTGPAVGTPLAAHPLVRKLAFTGSVATGRHLAKVAGDRLIPVTLELGGKSPVVVFADADLERAAAAAALAIQTNSGQVCSATTRLVVEDAAHDEVVARVVARLEKLQPGADFGPIITEAQFHKVLAAFADAERDGLTPLTGGSGYADGPGAAGQYVRPTVYADVPVTHPLAREEVFGPVLVTRRFSGEAEAVAVANDTEYGLVATVWSGDVARGLRVAERIQAGQVAVNGGPLTNDTPFGGYKDSGHGREKGLEALHDYAQTKTISLSLGQGTP
ncbi:aldehyde dehydrogenase [Frankia sp. CNm7]|uniref:Aldehyde dehydrogenase n=1 Tax=Frankia nepalensis TaxID=1836974 RepID=A0A937RV02_9ACTN|nr:aldehyde dehydrogenase family protein [Frankia nepalensis]MBL7500954.1 aldehyde dehydrogenase [Frankia nepalensis]MBL7510071.1 aldehyde dehydrogenase [Frankia nepalensis]MBL7521732.1 aldehyde dehydrogenase [Frankia nepalensis]MBL7633323.1 aldehyde dehydrogenase [Frankia nepalensis]